MTKKNLLKKLGQKLFPYLLTSTLALGTLPIHTCYTPVWDLMFSPVAELKANPTKGEAPLEVNFDGSWSGTLNPTRYIQKYHWDFDGDGKTDSITLGAYENHVYKEAGEYNASLFVVDNQGQKSDKDLEKIVVIKPPIAELMANPTKGEAPLEVNFDGSLSYARTPNCHIQKYHWDFDGDGETDLATSGAYINYTYKEGGEYNAGLVVVDNQGQKSNKDLEKIVVTEKEIFLDKIAFFGRRHYTGKEITDLEIYVMNSDGSEQTRLTDTIGDNFHHRWSPDSSKIAFTSRRDGDWKIYVMDADGKNQTNLSKNANGSDEFPSWSSDSSKIAFTSNRDGIRNQIYVMNADGSRQINISNAPFHDTKPAWSPDGSKIAFYSYYGGNMELMVMNADGSEQRVLTNTPENEEDNGPKWSPQGEILFTRGSPLNREIIVIYPNNKERNLSKHEADDAFPVWSPNGNHVAFASKRDGNWEIYTIKKNGSDLTRLTYTSDENVMPNWSSDGKWIAFMSNRESFPNFEIYKMRVNGNNQIRLTHFRGDENEPRWWRK